MTWVEWLRNLLAQAAPWFTVRPWEQGVRLRAGKHRELLYAGLYFKVPIPAPGVRLSDRLRTVYVATQTLRSKDGRTMVIGLILKYKIADLLKVLDTLHNPEGTLSHLAQGAVGRLVPDRLAAELTADALVAAIREAIDPATYGIEDFDVLVSDNADLSSRTFRLIQEGRWHSPDSEIDRMARQS